MGHNTDGEWNIYACHCFQTALYTAGTEIELIKSCWSPFLGWKTWSGEMKKKGGKRRGCGGLAGHGQPAPSCHTLGRNSRQWGSVVLQYIYTSPFPLTQTFTSRRIPGIDTDIWGQSSFLACLFYCRQGGCCFSVFNYTNLSGLIPLNVFEGYYSRTTQCAKSALINLLQRSG